MDYSKMSDFEINKAVGEIALDRRWACKPGHSGNETESWYYGSADSFADPLPLLPDYCNSWADAGPIIQEYGIELGYDGVAWEASCNLRGITPYSDWKKYPESPCRLAMIVFLMMHDKGEE
ncbi:MAG: phage protein NinX family protein [Mixta calida]|uniref:phage protein NinX family protein n=1 Tax=Mixta calida TaxID=665913 RepID=UPI0029086789|nr:phage protein NinX family protein [Mixta calida]MDU4943862.1 phage protein NinX family protein [Mixta calida]